MKSKDVATIVLSFTLMSIFISVFFFTYVAKVEEEVVKKHIDHIVSNILRDSDIVLTPVQKQVFRTSVIENLQAPDMSVEDAHVEENNRKIIETSFTVFGVLIGVGLLVVTVLWWRYRFDARTVVIHTLLLLAVTAITEFLFITFVTKKYVLIDENKVTYLFLDTLDKYANS